MWTRVPAAPQVGDDEWEGFHSWLRTRRAAEDRPRLWLSVVCTVLMLVRVSGELSMAHELYFALNLYFLLLLVAWSHLSPASYAHWRDAPAVALRLHIFFSPAFYALYQLTVNGPGSELPPTAGLLFATGPVLLTTLVLHLHVHAAMHPLPLWPAILVQCLCGAAAGGVPSRMALGCASRLTSHPSAQRIVWLVFNQLNRLSLVQPPAAARRDPLWVCRHSVLGLQLIGGVLGSLAVQAVGDARAFHEFSKQRHQARVAAVYRCGGSLYEKACDALSRRYLLRAAAWSRRPGLWLLAAAVIWNTVVWLCP